MGAALLGTRRRPDGYTRATEPISRSRSGSTQGLPVGVVVETTPRPEDCFTHYAAATEALPKLVLHSCLTVRWRCGHRRPAVASGSVTRNVFADMDRGLLATSILSRVIEEHPTRSAPSCEVCVVGSGATSEQCTPTAQRPYGPPEPLRIVGVACRCRWFYDYPITTR